MEYTLQNLDAEMALLSRLHAMDIGCHAFDWDTRWEHRREAVGSVIRNFQVQDKPFNPRLTISEQFKRAYGVTP